MTRETDLPKENPKEIRLKVEYHWPPDQTPIYANEMMIQQDPDCFHLSFFEVKPPFTSSEEAQAELTSLSSIGANCVARILISRSRFPSFVRAMQEAMKKEPCLRREDRRDG